MSLLRGVAAGFLLVIGSLLTVPGSIAIWQEREVLNEDNFVDNATAILDEEEVQQLVATRMADAIMVELDVSSRIDTALVNLSDSSEGDDGPGLTILQRPIVATAREAIFRACLRLVESDVGSNARDLVLRSSHQAFLALVENDSEAIEASGGRVVLDLRPLIVEALESVASERVATAASERLDPDAGQVVLVEGRNQTAVWKLLGWLDDYNPVVPLIAAAFLAAAIFVARSRVRMVGIVGGSIILMSAVSIVAASTPLKDLATSWPPSEEGQRAAGATFDVLLDSFRRQELYVALIGLALVVSSVLASNPRLFRAIRLDFGSSAIGEDDGFRSWVAMRLTVLRATGLAVAAITLLLWPEPTERLYLTAIALLVTYLAALWIVASEDSWATSVRGQVGRMFGGGDAGPPAHGIARFGGLLRLAGIVVALGVLILAPEVSVGLLVLTSAVCLLYIAGVDYLVSRSVRAPAETHEVPDEIPAPTWGQD